MKRLSQFKSLILSTLVAVPASFAQPGVSPYYKAPDTLSGRTVVIPAGTTFEGRIGSTIGSSVSKQGESFRITLSSPLLTNGSDVLIPAGAEVMGEVVQAIPAKDVPHAKKEKPTGKLRVQITALRLPDGMTYPMVGSLIGERTAVNPYGMYNPYNSGSNTVRGSGVAYVGTPTGFESVVPGKARYDRNGTPSVVTKNELLNDPVLGRDRSISDEKTEFRSLIKKNRNLFIYNGSPLTVRLEAPFKIGVGSSAGEASALELQTPKARGPAYKFPDVQTKQSSQPSPSFQSSPSPAQTNNTGARTPPNNNQDSNF